MPVKEMSFVVIIIKIEYNMKLTIFNKSWLLLEISLIVKY